MIVTPCSSVRLFTIKNVAGVVVVSLPFTDMQLVYLTAAILSNIKSAAYRMMPLLRVILKIVLFTQQGQTLSSRDGRTSTCFGIDFDSVSCSSRRDDMKLLGVAILFEFSIDLLLSRDHLLLVRP